MIPLRRVSMPEQVAASLRRGIVAARWLHELPSEAQLCRELHVSRVTLRRGVDRLVRDGWVSLGGRGRHHQIRKPSEFQRELLGRTVRVLSPYPLATLGSIQHVMLDGVSERLGPAKCHIEYEHRPSLFGRPSPGKFERLVTSPDTAAWMLFFSTSGMQRWFADNKVPCLVVGRLHEGVDLPCLSHDAPAVGRHAAGLFCLRGHRKLVYLIAEFTSLNDQLCSEAFAQEGRKLGCEVEIVTHPSDRSGLSRTLKLLLAARPCPTAFLSSCPEHCLTVLCYLREHGLRVPGDASIVAGWDDEFLHFSIPKFSCYQVDGTKMGRRAAALLLDLIRHGPDKSRLAFVLPTFVPGETLGPGPHVRPG